MSTEVMRDEFQWAYRAEVLKRNGKVCDWAIFMTEDDGSYVLPLVQSAWWAWQASRAALVVELPHEVTNVTNKEFEAGRDAVLLALESAGITVKP